ncbi:hypothetical protein J6590_094004, partial [Homalodisca vitripennis]
LNRVKTMGHLQLYLPTSSGQWNVPELHSDPTSVLCNRNVHAHMTACTICELDPPDNTTVSPHKLRAVERTRATQRSDQCIM